MITLQKFVVALEKIKVGGRWSLGLMVAEKKDLDEGCFPLLEKISIMEDSPEAKIIEKIKKAFLAKKWVILELKKNLSVGVYNQLKMLSMQNGINDVSGELVKQPDESRVVVIARGETIRMVEKKYPDFKYLFGPVVSLNQKSS